MITKLEKKEMFQVKGGKVVTKEEYCDTLYTLILHNYSTWDSATQDSAASAYDKYCQKYCREGCLNWQPLSVTYLFEFIYE